MTNIDRSGTKVCHITSVHRVNDVRVYHKECATLATAGYDVTLIGAAANTPDRGVKVVELPEGGTRFHRMIGRTRQAYKLALETNAHIYHFHDPELLPFGWMLKRKTGAKVIFDSHECFREDVIAKDWIPRPLRSAVGGAVGMVEDFVTRRIDMVVAATPHIAEQFYEHTKRVVPVNNYPLREEFSAASPASKRDAICYVGAISFVRGIIPFLGSLSFVDESVKVHVAGPFASKAVEDAAKGHPNWSRVTFHGQVDRDEVAKIYGQSFAGIVTFLPAPNHIFSQPNKLFEYMSAGVPVICSNFPLWRSVIEDEGCGVAVDPASPEAIGAAIEAMRTDREKNSQMAQRGKEAVENKFNWEREGVKLVTGYDMLVRELTAARAHPLH